VKFEHFSVSPEKAPTIVNFQERILFRFCFNSFQAPQDWQLIHTRYVRCAHTYFSAICVAAAALYLITEYCP
jgi:hypothetical protein